MWGIYTSINWVNTGSGNDLVHFRRQAITWANAVLLSIELTVKTVVKSQEKCAVETIVCKIQFTFCRPQLVKIIYEGVLQGAYLSAIKHGKSRKQARRSEWVGMVDGVWRGTNIYIINSCLSLNDQEPLSLTSNNSLPACISNYLDRNVIWHYLSVPKLQGWSR